MAAPRVRKKETTRARRWWVVALGVLGAVAIGTVQVAMRGTTTLRLINLGLFGVAMSCAILCCVEPVRPRKAQTTPRWLHAVTWFVLAVAFLLHAFQPR